MKNPLKSLRTQKVEKIPFTDYLRRLSDKAAGKESLALGEIFLLLSGKGYAVLLIVISFPFCLPFSLPGLSTFFGLLLAFLGLRLTFGHHLWWPKALLRKKISSVHIIQFVQKTKRFAGALQKVLHPRLVLLSTYPPFRKLHGILIFVLALLLALPIPLPLTNVLAALPILCLGLGLLEDDGLFIILGYALALLCLGMFWGLFLLIR